jgi:hypothetical protein
MPTILFRQILNEWKRDGGKAIFRFSLGDVDLYDSQSS